MEPRKMSKFERTMAISRIINKAEKDPEFKAKILAMAEKNKSQNKDEQNHPKKPKDK